MKIEERAQTSANDLNDRCRRAAKIFVTHETRQKYPNGFDALNAPPVTPLPPTTRGTATPHILLVGPFQDEPNLVGVAIYVGVGFIEVRNFDSIQHYELSAIGGDGIEARDVYLQTALRLYFDPGTAIREVNV